MAGISIYGEDNLFNLRVAKYFLAIFPKPLNCWSCVRQKSFVVKASHATTIQRISLPIYRTTKQLTITAEIAYVRWVSVTYNWLDISEVNLRDY